jgi:hypothetical protein
MVIFDANFTAKPRELQVIPTTLCLRDWGGGNGHQLEVAVVFERGVGRRYRQTKNQTEALS